MSQRVVATRQALYFIPQLIGSVTRMGLKPGTDSNRSIFADVAQAEKPVATPGQIDAGRGAGRSAIRGWLLALCALVVLTIVVGGLTRLTDSGLSITEWEPIRGMIPPLNADQWQAEFDAYRLIPEYIEQNAGMSLEEFKVIYWWEWGHRILGRVIGAVALLGFLYFLARKQIPTGWTAPLFGLGALVGVQGAVGWWMVHSGLQEGMLDVASYRLATHLGLAFTILGLAYVFSLHFLRRQSDLMQARRVGEGPLRTLATVLMVMTFVQILIGALVAGIDAGEAYATWPLMGDSFIPADPFALEPAWRNLFENQGTVQFIHRMWGYALAGFAVFVWLRARKSANSHTRFAFNLMIAVLALQIIIGIVTVLYAAQLHAAITHQLIAVVLWLTVLRARFFTRFPMPQSVRGTA